MTDIVERIKDAENATHALYNHIFQDAREEIERLRIENEALRAEIAALVDDMNLLRDNNTSLRAKIAEIERQEPVATVIKEGDSRYWMSERLWTFPDGKYSLYALPGAQTQGEEK